MKIAVEINVAAFKWVKNGIDKHCVMAARDVTSAR
jgi:hypothetical protein